MLQFHGCTGIGAEEALSEMAGLSSFGAAGYQALMPLGATSEKLEIAPAKLARTVGGKPKGTHLLASDLILRIAAQTKPRNRKTLFPYLCIT